MDAQAFASLAQVRILLVPVGSIRRNTFEKWATDVRSFEEIRLGDIPSDTKDDRARFMPNPLASGHLHLSFPSCPPPPSHTPLSLFRPSNFPLGIIGIASSSESESLPSILAQFKATSADAFPRNAIFPLANSCFVFEEGEGSTNIGESLPGIVVIPSMMGNKKLYIGTLLADLCSQILGAFATLMQTLESPMGNDYLNASLFPTMPSSGTRKSLDKTAVQNISAPPLSSHNSQSELVGPAVHRVKSPTGVPSKRNSSGLGNKPTPFRSSSLGVGAGASHGRLFKVLGDLFLLAGRTGDAGIWYTEAIVLFKLPQDTPWHASALEGIATLALLDAWSTGHGLNNSFSYGKEPWMELSEKMSQATALYSRYTPVSDLEQQSLLTYLYCTAVLRHASLLFSVWSAKGWGPLAFATMLHPGPNPLLPPALAPSPDSVIHRERMTSITGISRLQISNIMTQAHGPWLLHLGPRERIGILVSIASMYSCLGYKRKEALILREVSGCIMDMIVCGREEAGGPSVSVANKTIGLGIQGANVGTAPTGDSGMLGVRENESSDGNTSVLKMISYVCHIFGVDLQSVKLISALESAPSVDGHEMLSSVSLSEQDDDPIGGVKETHGWPELQVGIIREAVAIAEAVSDYTAVAQYSLSALATLHSILTAEDQLHLYSISSRALATARRRGQERMVEYWAGRPIVSIEIMPLPVVRLTVERPLSERTLRISDVVPILSGRADPFLYNPRKSLAGQTQAQVVQNELLQFTLTLQNPFAIDLELQSLSLSTSGVSFESKAVPVTIPANSFHPILMSGKPTETGVLIIRGCIAQIAGSKPREFTLPLSTTEEEDKRVQQRITLAAEAGRSKYAGLDSRPWERARKRASDLAKDSRSMGAHVFRFLECNVIPEQPLMRIRRTSLTHGAIMLYNGEVSTIRLTLENVSALPIDYIKLTFDDSTTIASQQSLADGTLSVFDTYETEFDLMHRPVFSWKPETEPKEVSPGRKIVVTVTCLGKAGCASGTIQVLYSYLKRPQPSIQQPVETFQTRRLVYPVLVTVYHMLECHGMDILPYNGVETSDTPAPADEIYRDAASRARRCLLEVGEDPGWCLFTVDVRNTYGTPFEVTFERIQDDPSPVSTTCIVPPGSTNRIILPIKKFLLPEACSSQVIPTLSDRQFVVTKSSLTSTEDKAQRELFWYREELFKCVRGHWKEAGGARSGDLSLRQQRMTMPMLEALRTETARVHLSLVHYGSEAYEGVGAETISCKAGKCFCPSNEFVHLRTKVINMSPEPLVLTIHVGCDPTEHVIYEGILSDVPLGRLEPGESREIETALCFLSQGRFELTAAVRRVGAPPDERSVGLGELKVIVKA